MAPIVFPAMMLFRPPRLMLSLVTAVVCTSSAAESARNVVYVSPSGAFQVELEDPGTSDAVVVSTANPKQRVKIVESRTADEFHFSPDDEWLFALRHVGSGLRDGDLYHRLGPAKIEELKVGGSFSRSAWENAVKLGAIKRNFDHEGLYAMTYFVGWSADSSRLLVEVGGGEEKRSFQFGHLYFNVRTKRFELTDYLRKVNKLREPPRACAEPLTPLPEEAELRKQFEQADATLNKVYQEKIARAAKDEVAGLREDQREWIKERDAGVGFYAAIGTPAEKERRRLQFMSAVTAARIDTLRAQ